MDDLDIPVVAVVVGVDVPARLGHREVPVYALPEEAIRALSHACRYAAWRRAPRGVRPSPDDVDRHRARKLVRHVLDTSAGWQPTEVWRPLLAAYGIRPVPSSTARQSASRPPAADSLGYPVALKAAAPELVHKSDVGAVILDIAGPDAVADAYTPDRRCTRSGSTRRARPGHGAGRCRTRRRDRARSALRLRGESACWWDHHRPRPGSRASARPGHRRRRRPGCGAGSRSHHCSAATADVRPPIPPPSRTSCNDWACWPRMCRRSPSSTSTPSSSRTDGLALVDVKLRLAPIDVEADPVPQSAVSAAPPGSEKDATVGYVTPSLGLGAGPKSSPGDVFRRWPDRPQPTRLSLKQAEEKRPRPCPMLDGPSDSSYLEEALPVRVLRTACGGDGWPNRIRVARRGADPPGRLSPRRRPPALREDQPARNRWPSWPRSMLPLRSRSTITPVTSESPGAC